MNLVEARYGNMYIIESDNVVSRALSMYGEWAEDEIELLKEFISPGFCVLDVGAFIGTHTIAFSNFTGGAGHVYSFEPRKEIYEVLVKTIELNGFDNVHVLNCGVSSRSGKILLPVVDINDQLNFGALPLDYNFSGESGQSYEVDVVSIDEMQIPCKVSIIKIDVEGMERKVLDGALETLGRDNPIVLCECNSLSSGVEILNYCEKVGYLVYGYLSSAYNKKNFKAERENIFGQAKELSLLLVPEERRDDVVQCGHCNRLFLIKTPEDLVLPLLHKPQYPHEVLVNTSAAHLMGINFPSPSNDKIEIEHGKELAQLDQQVLQLKQTLQEREDQIGSIVKSKSWRLTYPLRVIGQVVRLRVWKNFSRLSRNVLISVRGEIRRHGLLGFVQRIPRYLRNYRMYVKILMLRPSAVDGVVFQNKAPDLRVLRLHPELTNEIGLFDKKISVVIPTLNAGVEFGLLLRKLRDQQGLTDLEIVIVDSGSTDETIVLAKKFGCRIIEIPSRDFSHSHARNVGADAADGEYLLFMVQDAYPIGRYWAYGMVSYILDHADDGLVAASCAEYSRSDSDILYDSMINTHYRFLGCLDYDRIGEFSGEDHISLRSYGQLSDVSCLISKSVFDLYRYRGDYAEDLDLGVRLIKDGYRISMLASVKVIHSHNRPSFYYLKRSFVDVYFLVGLFDDFVYPRVSSPLGVVVGVVSTALHLSHWLSDFDKSGQDTHVGNEIAGWIRRWRKDFSDIDITGRSKLGDDRLNCYIDSLADRYLGQAGIPRDENSQYEIRRFLEAFLSRVEHFSAFVSEVYLEQDTYLRQGLSDAIIKIFSSTAGSALSFMCLDISSNPGEYDQMAVEISNVLRAGV